MFNCYLTRVQQPRNKFGVNSIPLLRCGLIVRRTPSESRIRIRIWIFKISLLFKIDRISQKEMHSNIKKKDRMSIDRSILHAIGNTSLVQLRNVVPPGCAQVFAKLEWENPTGSMKDRMAQAMISRAEEEGRLKPGDVVVEYTGGSTGISLALICVAKRYRLHIITSDAFSKDKLNQMAAFGAELTLIPSEGGLTTKKLILDMIEAAREFSKRPHTYWTDQLNNLDSIAGYYPLAEEIWN